MLDVKQVNAEVVLWELWALRTASVKELSQRTGLSFATVASILSGFVETGEVVLGGRLSGTGGRPSQAYVFNAEFAHILALSAQVRNGTHLIRSSVGTLYGETIATNEKSFDQIELISFRNYGRCRPPGTPKDQGCGLRSAGSGAGWQSVGERLPGS